MTPQQRRAFAERFRQKWAAKSPPREDWPASVPRIAWYLSDYDRRFLICLQIACD
jgi:hypothetical protein